MKKCPQCDEQYEDFMRFCMKDGTPLDEGAADESAAVTSVDTSDSAADQEVEGYKTQQIPAAPLTDDDIEQETVIRRDPGQKVAIKAPPAPGKPAQGSNKSNLLILLAAIVFGGFILLAAVGGVGLWWYLGSGNEIAVANTNANIDSNSAENANLDELSNDDANVDANSSPSPTKSPTPSPSPTKTPTPSPSPSPTVSPSPTPTVSPTASPTRTPTPTRTPPPATPTPAGTPRTVSGGVVNAKALSLPKPSYPSSARSVGARGPVSVRVLIDERGRVVSARAISGHPLLRRPAADAARRARFAPTVLSGQPVRVSGVITYIFN